MSKNIDNAEIIICIVVEHLGNRLTSEVVSITKNFTVPHQFIVIAHSLGGLITRYAFGELSTNPLTRHGGPDSKLHWASFITMCTPHLGVRKPGKRLFKQPS